MKFRAVMTEPAHMREFNNIVSTVSRLSKECVLRVSETHLYLIVSEESGAPTAPVLWCALPQAAFFSEYHSVGLDDQHRDIYLGISPVILARCLGTLKSAKSIKIKLTKKQVPCLSLDIEVPLNSNASATIGGLETHHITHDISVTVVPRKMWPDFHEPNIPSTHICIELPPLKTVRTSVERMKSLCSEIRVSAGSDGRLSLRVTTDAAQLCTRFRDLRLHSFSAHEEDSDDEEASQNSTETCYCRIDAKKFSMFLNVDQIANIRESTCSIVHKKVVILSLETDLGVKMQCFIPGIVS